MSTYIIHNGTLMSSELYHYGVKGMKWGVRRYQKKDGTLTDAGKKRYNPETKTFLSRKDYHAKMEADYKRIAKEERDKRNYSALEAEAYKREMAMYKKYGVKNPEDAAPDDVWDGIDPSDWDKAQAEYDKIWEKPSNVSREARYAADKRIREIYGADYDKYRNGQAAAGIAAGVIGVTATVAVPIVIVKTGKYAAKKAIQALCNK